MDTQIIKNVTIHIDMTLAELSRLRYLAEAGLRLQPETTQEDEDLLGELTLAEQKGKL